MNVCFTASSQKINKSFVSTEILPDQRVAFRIYAPKAKEVKLVADGKWDKVEFTKDDQGVWEGFWKQADRGAYHYHFLVDGVVVNDPKSPIVSEAKALFMMTDGSDFFALKKDVAHGAMAQRHYYSKTLKKTRRIHVWTPAGFEKSKDKLPVLYLIHGGGGTDMSWASIGCAGNILDNLLAEGKIEPMIVVLPNGSVDIDTPTMLERVPIFKMDLMTDIIPFVESNYPVYADASHRAIMGLSFGGLETLEAVIDHPKSFEYIGVLSSGWWISDVWKKERGWMDNKEKKAKRLLEIADDLNTSVKLLYFTQGGPEDLAYDNGVETLKLFDAAGIKYKYSEMPGGHTWMVWRKNLKEIAPLLFKE